MKEARTEHVYTFGLSALFGEIESEIATVEFVVPTMLINPYQFGTNNITGTYTGEISQGKLYVNDQYGDVIGGSFNNGDFTFYAKGKFEAADKVELEGLGANGAVVVEKQLVEIITE